MSRNEEPLEETNLEEAEEAFIDLEDPNLEILDDGNDDGAEKTSDDGDEEAGPDGPGASGNGGGANEEGNDDGDQDPQQDAEMIDLNEVPDREPERDDALATFSSPGNLPIHAVAAHPRNQRLFAACGEGEEIYILELQEDASLALLHKLKGHTNTVSLLSFSPNGEWLATGGLDSTIGLWSTTTWERAHSLTDLYGEIMCLLWHPSSLLLVGGADDAQAAMWNVVKGSLAMYYVGHRGPVTCCIWSPDHKKLVTGSSDGSVSVYNPKTGEAEVSVNKDLSPDNAGVTTLKFAKTDQCIVGCEDGTMHVLSLSSGRVVTHLEDLHEQAIESLEVNDSSTLLVSSSCDTKVIVWNVADFSPRVTLNVGESVIPAAWARGSLIVAGCSDGNVRVWDGRSAEQEPLQTLMGHRRMVLSITVSGGENCERVVCSGGDDGLVKCFRLPTPAQ